MEKDKTLEYFIRKCKCGEEVKAPREYPGDDAIRLYQVCCPKGHRAFTFDYILMRWWR